MNLFNTFTTYEHKKRWKQILIAFAVLIGASSVIYTQVLIDKLATEEKRRVELWAQCTKMILETEDSDFLNFLLEIIDNNASMPVILTDAEGKIISYRELDSLKTLNKEEPGKKYDLAYFQKELEIMKSQHEPIIFEYLPEQFNYIYYKESSLLTQLRYYPYIQLGVISIFFLVAYLAFSASRRAEQNRVWVGMSKETAHQLGTPLSSLLAWMELLRAKKNFDPEIIEEMQNDVQRLELITERFSKIGSKPVLLSVDLVSAVEKAVNYMRKRSPERINYVVKGESLTAMINIPLFEWVIENLCTNAINAMGLSGTITIKMGNFKNQIYVDVSDTGSGIPKSKFNTVFQPGYTTRKRGWGLGLSLVKRIIESYHSGQIFVKESETGKGTTFRILLRK